ncbi:MAG: tetratricopeptide repeat protein [Silvibacterium sp.]|nr:tetratricopeptide repeat protein [Silvibacterium sp.]
MPVPATMFALLLLSLTCAAQQSQSSDQSQGSSQPQSQNQKQAQPEKDSAKHRSTADDNPFPEDISKKAAVAAGNAASDAPAPSAPTAPAPSSGSSKAIDPADKSAPATSSSRTGLRGLDDVDTPESRISDGAGGYVYSPKLAAQDVKVGGFYLDNGNFEGAYSRFKEATKVDPGNPDAVFGLAEAARGLKKNNEAADNYRIFLDAVPNGSKAKAAKKALAALGESAKK